MALEILNFYDIFLNYVFGGSIFITMIGFAGLLFIIGMFTRMTYNMISVIIMFFLYSFLLVYQPILAMLIFIGGAMYFGYNLMKFVYRRDDI